MILRFTTHARVYLIFPSAVLFNPRDARKLAMPVFWHLLEACFLLSLRSGDCLIHVDLHQCHVPSINRKIL